MYKQRTHKENQEVYVRVLAQGYYTADLNIHDGLIFVLLGSFGLCINFFSEVNV